MEDKNEDKNFILSSWHIIFAETLCSMAAIIKTLSDRRDQRGFSQIMIRVSLSRSKKLRIKSGIYIPSNRWNKAKQRIEYAKSIFDEREYLAECDTKLKTIEAKIFRICELYPDIDSKAISDILAKSGDITPNRIDKKYIETIIDGKNGKSVFDLMSIYIESTKLSETRERNFKVLIRALKRYEAFIRLYDKNERFRIDFDTLDSERLSDFADFLKNEHSLYEEFPNIFSLIPANTDVRKSPVPAERGSNTIVILMKKLRAFLNWCVKQGYTDKQPFLKYDGKMSEKYGTPYYITLDERNVIADFPLSGELERQRDIFIFQCCIGCRVSDLMRLTDKNIIDGAVEYIPQKTRNERPQVIRVPLNERAKALVEKYKGVDKNGMLFPFITPQRYNDNIKKVFKACGITRIVSVLNPLTGMEEQRPINEVASSHMARRTFIGNLYKQVQDPNLIGSLSGHKYGSQAFSRYRDVDEEMKKDLVSLIE